MTSCRSHLDLCWCIFLLNTPTVLQSISAPLAAGLIALIWSVEPSLTPNEVETILKMGADDVGLAGAYGRINSKTSVQAAESGTAFVSFSSTYSNTMSFKPTVPLRVYLVCFAAD